MHCHGVSIDRCDYELELDVNEVVEQGKAVGMHLANAVESDKHEDRKVNAIKWGRLYGKYTAYNPQHYWRQSLYLKRSQGLLRHPDTLFRPVDRLRLIDSIINGDPLVGNCGISITHHSDHLLSNLLYLCPIK
jgi:hypothetical protein